MNRDEFTYYNECQLISSLYRVPRHEVQFEARKRAKAYMVKEEIIEVVYAAAMLVATEYSLALPNRSVTVDHKAKIKKLSRELDREILVATPDNYKKILC